MNRRDFFKIAAGGVGAAVLTSPALMGDVFANGRFRAQPRTDSAVHLAHRITFGNQPGLVESIRAMGVEAYIEQQLHPETLDDSALEARLSSFDVLQKSSEELRDAYDAMRGEVVRQFIGAMVLRAIYSQRQLHEMMVHFWSDHFNIYIRKGACFFFKPVEDRDVIRQHALGNFRELLGASARSPAMLFYLDNAFSNRRRPNENYARELMELHTLGVTQHYTETDVQEVARCFTGWIIGNERRGGEVGQFLFDEQMHDRGQKTVMGQVIPAGGGIADGEKVLDMLAEHPSTAWFIALKLVRRFVSDNPPPALVDACAAAFMQSSGDIKTVLSTLFASDAFWNATPKFRRPFELMAAGFRAMNYDIQRVNPMFRAVSEYLNATGHMPFMHVTPEGYPDLQDAWTGNLLARWNLAFGLAYGDRQVGHPQFESIIQNTPLEADALLDFFAGYLLGRPLTADEAAILRDFMGNPDLDTEAGRLRIKDTIGLLMASPAFQYR